jgi:cytochrome c oxidase subunit IV
MAHLTYEESKSRAVKIITILGIITILEVVIALFAKGHINENISAPIWITVIVMITLSLYKAYLIVYEFMHMKYEVPDLVKTVLIPTVLLVWAVIAFFWEGNDWQRRRDLIQNKNAETINTDVKAVQQGMLLDKETNRDLIK